MGLVLLLAPAAAAAETHSYLGPSTLVAAPDGRTLYVGQADSRHLAWVDVPSGKVTRSVALPAQPSGLALAPNAQRLYVTCAAPRSQVLVFEPATACQLATLPAGHTALSPVVSPDGQRLYVCNRFDNNVSVLDLTSGRELARVATVREPIAAAVTPDGRTLLVANHLPNARTDAAFKDRIAATVTVIDTQTLATSAIVLGAGANGCRGLCVSPDGHYAYVTHIISNFHLAPIRVDMGWTNMNVLSVLDIPARKLLNTVALDELYLGAGNPWGVACTADGQTICVSQSGTHELAVLEAAALRKPLAQMFMSPVVGSLAADPQLGLAPWWRVRLPGQGPRGIAVAGSQVFLAEYFSDAVAQVDLQAAGRAPVRSLPLGPPPHLTDRRRGEMLFHDALICFQHWQSCSSCHPDGRADALNWDLLNDGMNNPKNTKSLLLAHRTPPAMAEGVRPNAEAAVRAGMENILLASRPDEELAAIDEYLKSLLPVPSPHLQEGRLSPAAERGQRLFQDDAVGCAKCHPAPLYTDLKMHNVGSRGPSDYVERFDTPTLIEVWRTAPYLHDGRYLTVKELLVDGRHGSSRGRVAELSAQQLDDLVEFVLSL